MKEMALKTMRIQKNKLPLRTYRRRHVKIFGCHCVNFSFAPHRVIEAFIPITDIYTKAAGYYFAHFKLLLVVACYANYHELISLISISKS